MDEGEEEGGLRREMMGWMRWRVALNGTDGGAAGRRDSSAVRMVSFLLTSVGSEEGDEAAESIVVDEAVSCAVGSGSLGMLGGTT